MVTTVPSHKDDRSHDLTHYRKLLPVPVSYYNVSDGSATFHTTALTYTGRASLPLFVERLLHKRWRQQRRFPCQDLARSETHPGQCPYDSTGFMSIENACPAHTASSSVASSAPGILDTLICHRYYHKALMTALQSWPLNARSLS